MSASIERTTISGEVSLAATIATLKVEFWQAKPVEPLDAKMPQHGSKSSRHYQADL